MSKLSPRGGLFPVHVHLRVRVVLDAREVRDGADDIEHAGRSCNSMSFYLSLSFVQQQQASLA